MLPTAPIYAFEPGAVNLGTIRAIVKPKRQHTRRKGVEHDAERGKHEIEKEDLNEERGRADELHDRGNRPPRAGMAIRRSASMRPRIAAAKKPRSVASIVTMAARARTGRISKV